MAKKKEAAPAEEPKAKGKKAAPAAKGKGVAKGKGSASKAAAPVKSITKKELQSQLVTRSSLAKAQVESVYDALVAIITENLSSKGPKTLTLPGLGKLVSVAKAADPGGRDVRNPFTGATVKSKPREASMQVRFRPSKTFKGGLGA